ncbi:MAG: hypothetical protein K6G90_01535, partial [Clostridia bacterium]|nr:hypothetical protein [Clostridia bacterium]
MSEEAIFGRLCEKFREMTAVYEKLLYTPVGTVSDFYGLQTKEHFRSVPESGFEPIAPGTSWGGAWQNLWVKCAYTVPEEAEGKKLYILSSCGGREQLQFIDGVPKGIYNSGAHRTLGDNHDAQYLGIGRADREYELAFECYAGHFDVDTDPYNNYDYPDIPMPEFRHTFGGVKVCTRDDELYTLLYDIRELINLSRAGHIPFVAGKAKQALRRIDETIVLYPKHASPEAVRAGIRKSLDISRPFFTGGNSRVFGRVGITGHSHMDTAWLWPVSETVRKCARTYSNALHLMEQYPDYRFIQSSTLHGEWMKDYYPTIFADMKKYVAEGRYEPNGGVYVECDGNMTSGEFMIRQFLKGQQFTRENFNYTADTFWLQDTFGYNANIPQIMRGCEVKYFCTNKLGWNELNRFPYESFVWHGLDGSDVIVHFPCTHGFPDVGAAYGSVADISEKDSTDLRLVAFGFGDGGGGPTAGMLETAARAIKTSGLPEVESMSVSQFMQELEEQKEALPVYGDELYLEYHRGTLTQLHDVKRMNRKAEYTFRNMEYFNVLAGEPKHPESDKWLKTILKNQFHDILPGTAITEVFELYRKEMREVIDSLNSAADKYAEILTDDGDSITLFNTLSFDRHDPAAVETEGYAKNQPSQRYTDVCGRKLLAIGSLTLPAFGNVSIDITSEPLPASSPFIYDGRKLTTPYAEIVFDANGAISSFTDKSSGRELRRPG